MLRLENDIREVLAAFHIPLYFYDCPISEIDGSKPMPAVHLKALRPMRERDGVCEFSIQLSIWCEYKTICGDWATMKAKHKAHIYEKQKVLRTIIDILTKPKPYKFGYTLPANRNFVDYSFINHPVTQNCIYGVVAELTLSYCKTHLELKEQCCDDLLFDKQAFFTGRFARKN